MSLQLFCQVVTLKSPGYGGDMEKLIKLLDSPVQVMIEGYLVTLEAKGEQVWATGNKSTKMVREKHAAFWTGILSHERKATAPGQWQFVVLPSGPTWVRTPLTFSASVPSSNKYAL
jgi:hypothetical protein